MHPSSLLPRRPNTVQRPNDRFELPSGALFDQQRISFPIVFGSHRIHTSPPKILQFASARTQQPKEAQMPHFDPIPPLDHIHSIIIQQ
jgi:hypothetical protein